MSEQMTVLGFDFETLLIGPQRVSPPAVCLTAHDGEADVIFGRQEVEDLHTLIGVLLDHEDGLTIRAAHNLSFDLAVACNERPDLIPMAFDLLERGLLQCTIVREKLLNLTEGGHVDFYEDGGNTIKTDYSLAGLVKKYYKQDITGSKKGDDAWRLNYGVLWDTPVGEYPEEAVAYAVEDSVWARKVWFAQESYRQHVIEDTGKDPFKTLAFQCQADFCLFLMTCWGIAVDAEHKAKIEATLADCLSPDNLKHLIQSGILIPATPPRPYKNGATDADGNPKMTNGTPEKIAQTKLRELVQRVVEGEGGQVRMTDPSNKFPEGQVSLAADYMEEIAHLHPVLQEYCDRQSLQKIVGTELPRMCWEGKTAEIVHPCYDVLKNTGRTSSYASSLYPSFNCQNVARPMKAPNGDLISVRGCFVPRPGNLLFSIDYAGMELGTLGQTCLNLFGFSVHAEKINAGYDLHTFLAAQIARKTDPGFGQFAPEDRDECYRLLMDMRKGLYKGSWMPDPVIYDGAEKFAKHFRNLAKPTGLGYPGGLGADTFVAYAKATYGVVIDVETARLLKDIWQDTYEEMPEYFRYINNELVDPRFSRPDWTKYWYETPMGLYRPNADYCAAANGLGLQSPSAEGAKGSVILTVRETLDYSRGSILLPDEKGPTLKPICFIHDELVGEVRDDEQAHPRVNRVCELMVESMRVVTPDVTPRVEPALMRRWDKDAEAVYDEQGRLIPWTPKGM